MKRAPKKLPERCVPEDPKTSLLRRSVERIRALQHQNEVLAAQVSTMHVFSRFLDLATGNRTCCGSAQDDLTWQIERELNSKPPEPPESLFKAKRS